MHIPKKFKLGGITWTVKEFDYTPGVLGSTSSHEAVIILLKSLPKEIKEQTFLHELTHAILFSMGIQQSDHDEKFIDGFATFLHQFLQQQ